MADFIKALEAERARIQARITEIHTQRDTLDDELTKLETELRAFDAYEHAKEGKAPARKGRTGPRGPRGPRKTGLKESVKNVIVSAPNGLSRGEIIELMGAKEDKKAQQSISNTLQILKKANEVQSKDGKYLAA